MNIKKTNYIVFSRRSIASKNNIKIDNTILEPVDKIKFLGVILNSHLTWGDHIKFISTKIAKNIGILYKIQNKIPKNTLVNLYFTLVHPYYEYCNIVWAADHTSALETLIRSQKKAIRIISHSKRNAHTEEIFKRLKILNIHQLNKFQLACFVYKSVNKLLPPQFNNIFNLNNKLHSYDTRHATKY